MKKEKKMTNCNFCRSQSDVFNDLFNGCQRFGVNYAMFRASLYTEYNMGIKNNITKHQTIGKDNKQQIFGVL